MPIIISCKPVFWESESQLWFSSYDLLLCLWTRNTMDGFLDEDLNKALLLHGVAKRLQILNCPLTANGGTASWPTAWLPKRNTIRARGMKLCLRMIYQKKFSVLNALVSNYARGFESVSLMPRHFSNLIKNVAIKQRIIFITTGNITILSLTASLEFFWYWTNCSRLLFVDASLKQSALRQNRHGV